MRSHLFTFVLLVLLFLIPSAYADFSDDFNDSSITDWTVTSGSWGVTATPFYLHATSTTGGISHNIGTGIKFIQIDFKAPLTQTGDSSTVCWAVGRCVVIFSNFPAGGTITGTGFSINSVGISPTVNMRIQMEIVNSNTQMNFSVYNLDTGALISSQQVAYTYVESGTATISASWASGYSANYFNYVNFASVSPQSSTSISWQYTSYTVGDSPKFSWSIKDIDWNSHPLQIYVARLYKSGIMQDWGTFNWICLCSSQLAVAQSGDYIVSADVPGTYQVTLELLNPITGNSPVTDSSTSVHAQSSSYFTIPSTAFIKTNTTATYHIGVGGRTGAIDWYFLDNGIEEREAGKILTGTDGTVNITFSRVGTYNVYLKSVTGTAETFQMHTVVTSFIPSTPTNNFSTSSITLIPVNGSGGSFGSYHMNEVLFGNYSIKSSVFANEGTFFLDIFNNDAQAITTTYYGSGGTSIGYNDFGTFALVISNNANDVLKTHWIPGNNSVRLRIQYPNGTLATLATDTFSLSKLTISGYGLDVTPLQVSINQPVTATATTPESNSSLVITGANGYSKTYALPAGTTTLTTSFNQPGIYGFNLYSSFGYLAMSTQVTVSTVVVTPTPSTTGGTSTNTLNFISSGSFLALIIFVTIIGLGGALAGAVGFLVGTFVSIPLLYLAGLIPLWVVFLDAGTVFLGLSIMIIHQLTKSS